jgi:adenine deaminase
VLGLAEFMNYPGVIHRDPGCMEKLRAFAGRHIDGHAPLLSGRDLNAYVAAGIRTEHEATSRRRGAREADEGAAGADPRGVGQQGPRGAGRGADAATAPYMCLCTDDRNPLDIAEHGHLDYMIRRLIARAAIRFRSTARRA